MRTIYVYNIINDHKFPYIAEIAFQNDVPTKEGLNVSNFKRKVYNII